MSKIFRFSSALVGDHWRDNVEIEVSSDGLIESVKDCSHDLTDGLVALPGMINVHSHAFQRGFVGLSEYRTAEKDSFWTWRDQMYRFVSELDPESVYRIAKQLYQEILAAGYTWVGEFHYLHRLTPDRSNPTELSDAIERAASESGIGLCHLPVLYQRGGFENESLVRGQNRFALTVEQFTRLFDWCRSRWADRPNTKVGMALHSLRAVSVSSAVDAVDQIRSVDPQAPIHVHVAEQVQEVAQCTKVHQRRPVKFLFDSLPVDRHWCLIHATHLDESELDLIACSNAVVGLCPTTEANLGDGIFQARDFLDRHGRISIGSDSHCSIDFREELRLLEYGQRLTGRCRAVLGTDKRSVGRNLYCLATQGGAQALGINAGEIAVGKRADFTLVDARHPCIGNVKGDRLMDRLIFANIGNPIAGVIVGGNQIDCENRI